MKIFHWVERILFGYIFIILILFFHGVITRNTYLLLDIFLVLVPLGLLIAVAQSGLKAIMIRRRSKEIAYGLLEASRFLGKDPPDLVLFDATLSLSIDPFPIDIPSNYLVGTASMLSRARQLILSEWSRRLLEQTTEDFIPSIKKMAIHLREVSIGVNDNDIVKTLEGISNLLARYFIFTRGIRSDELPPYILDRFISACDEISMYLKQGHTSYAEYTINQVLESFKGFSPSNKFNWQILIWFWLHHRFHTITVQPTNPKFLSLWIKSESLLAVQLDIAISSLVANDFFALSELIYESYKPNMRVPNFLEPFIPD